MEKNSSMTIILETGRYRRKIKRLSVAAFGNTGLGWGEEEQETAVFVRIFIELCELLIHKPVYLK